MHVFKGKIFVKLIFIFSIITILSVSGLAMFIYQTNKKNVALDGTIKNKKVMTNLAFFLDENLAETENLLSHFYSDSHLNRHVRYLLDTSLRDYLTFSMIEFTKSQSSLPNNLDTYLKDCFKQDQNLAIIDLYSLSQDYVMRASIKGYETLDKDRTADIEQALITKRNLALPYKYPITPYTDGNQQLYTIQYPIYDYFTLEIMGYVYFRYNIHKIADFLSPYSESNEGILTLSNNQGDVIYCTADKKTHLDASKELITPRISPRRAPNLFITTTLPANYVKHKTAPFNRLLLFITSTLVLVITFVSYLSISRFHKRINKIISAIQKVQSGDLSIRLEETQDQDELSIISKQFNQMCLDLDVYIKKFYLAELKQKDTQFLALQRQINPHFLYNNLEAIRMKALADGNRDVGEMIYILSTLYRRSIKDGTLIDLDDELEYSEMYLSLFKIRYDDFFEFSIDVDEEIQDASIISLTLQPIIENYILHGFKTDGTMNRLVISGYKKSNDFYLTIEDNGSGMNPEKLASIKEHLLTPQRAKTDSIGLLNIQERIHMIYGSLYGVHIESEENEGTRVTIHMPYTVKADEAI